MKKASAALRTRIITLPGCIFQAKRKERNGTMIEKNLTGPLAATPLHSAPAAIQAALGIFSNVTFSDDAYDEALSEADADVELQLQIAALRALSKSPSGKPERRKRNA